MQTYFKIFELNCIISNILWLFYIRFVSNKTRNVTKGKQEITCSNNFLLFLLICLFCLPLDEDKKISLISSKLSCIRQVNEFLRHNSPERDITTR